MRRKRRRPLRLPAEDREMILDASTPVPILGAENSLSLTCHLGSPATRHVFPLFLFTDPMPAVDAALSILHRITVT